MPTRDHRRQSRLLQSQSALDGTDWTAQTPQPASSPELSLACRVMNDLQQRWRVTLYDATHGLSAECFGREELLDIKGPLENSLFPVVAQAGFKCLAVGFDAVRPEILAHQRTVFVT